MQIEDSKQKLNLEFRILNLIHREKLKIVNPDCRIQNAKCKFQIEDYRHILSFGIHSLFFET